MYAPAACRLAATDRSLRPPAGDDDDIGWDLGDDLDCDLGGDAMQMQRWFVVPETASYAFTILIFGSTLAPLSACRFHHVLVVYLDHV
jgi:hypothetical protein